MPSWMLAELQRAEDGSPVVLIKIAPPRPLEAVSVTALGPRGEALHPPVRLRDCAEQSTFVLPLTPSPRLRQVRCVAVPKEGPCAIEIIETESMLLPALRRPETPQAPLSEAAMAELSCILDEVDCSHDESAFQMFVDHFHEGLPSDSAPERDKVCSIFRDLFSLEGGEE